MEPEDNVTSWLLQPEVLRAVPTVYGTCFVLGTRLGSVGVTQKPWQSSFPILSGAG